MKIGKTYKINTSNSLYTAKVIQYNKPFITIIDKYGKEININETDVLKYYEV